MDGHAATHAIRELPRFGGLPIVAMTAHAMNEERERCLREGMQDHISKPIDPAQLTAIVNRWLSIDIPSERTPEVPTPPPPSDSPPAELVIPSVDVAAGLRRVGGNRALYTRLLRQFAERYRQTPSRLAGLVESNRAQAEHDAHAIKGVAANLGITELQALAGKLEEALRGGAAIDALQTDAAELDRQLAITCDAIGASLPVDVVTAPADMPPLANLIDDLKQRLRDNDGEAIDLIAANQPRLQRGLGDSFTAVERAVQQYDYDAALAMLEVLASRAGITPTKTALTSPNHD
jgi:two-component system sensor histidine kinase/response regulator